MSFFSENFYFFLPFLTSLLIKYANVFFLMSVWNIKMLLIFLTFTWYSIIRIYSMSAHSEMSITSYESGCVDIIWTNSSVCTKISIP